MAIKYVQVLNSFVSTEGSGGFMTNYIYYSLLVVDTNGSKKIVEGKADQISYLLPLVRTPIDEIEELKETVKNLRRDINDIADQKAKYLVDSIFPIPDILNKTEVEAVDLLEKAGFQPVFLNQYAETVPKNGIVRAFARNGDNFKKVDIKIIHDVPQITGLKIEDAQEQLAAAGFEAKITHKIVTDNEDGTVLKCTRDDENKMNVSLLVSRAIPETKDLPVEEAERILKEAGYETVISQSAELGKPGQVLRWASISESTIRLYVSIPSKYETKRVAVKWSNMQDSTGDSYSATAEFSNSTQYLDLRLTYTAGVKTKHQIIGAEMDSLRKLSTASDYDYFGSKSNVFPIVGYIRPDVYMDPGVEGTVLIDFPFKRPFSELPKEVKVNLQTQYGLMKKKDPVELQLTFDW